MSKSLMYYFFHTLICSLVNFLTWQTFKFIFIAFNIPSYFNIFVNEDRYYWRVNIIHKQKKREK